MKKLVLSPFLLVLVVFGAIPAHSGVFSSITSTVNAVAVKAKSALSDAIPVKQVAAITAVTATVILSFYLASQAYCGNSPKECWNFFREYCRHPKEIGFPAPCSRFLAEELTSQIPFDLGERRPLRILEIGAGTGIVTRSILAKMGQNDRLDVVELEQPLCDILQQKFAADSRVKISCCSILDFKSEKPYDAIISTIPYNLLPLELVKEMFAHKFSLAAAGAPISYVALMGGAVIKNATTRGEENKKFQQHQAFLKQQFEVCGKRVVNWIPSWPPITVTHLQNKQGEKLFDSLFEKLKKD